MNADSICQKAASLVSGDREKQHGNKTLNHDNIAKLWQAYLKIRSDPTAPLNALDAAHMMCLLKIARTQSGVVNPDDYIDLAGYAGVAGEIALNEPPVVVDLYDPARDM